MRSRRTQNAAVVQFNRLEQGDHSASLTQPTLSIWQSAVLAYASAQCGISFSSIGQIDKWLRTNPQDSKHSAVRAVCTLLITEPPKSGRPFYHPASDGSLTRPTRTRQEIAKNADQS